MVPVYFTDLRARHSENLFDKLAKLFKKAGFEELISKKDLVAVKLHFGEKGNTGYLNPLFVRNIVDQVKKLGGKPFLTDTNTLYAGSRENSIDHLQTAIENGFAYAVTAASLIIADGLNGKDYISVPVNLKYFKEVKIGSAIYHADVLLMLSHFKGHMLCGFGGVLKNLGMGCGSRAGKLAMHSDISPLVRSERCTGCGQCASWCPGEAITLKDSKENKKTAVIDKKKCIGCGECIITCRSRAIDVNWKTEPSVIQEKIVEYAAGALKNKQGKAGFINFVINVTPDCDCTSWTDASIVRDIGILASTDPVALDTACVDLVNQEKALPGSVLGGKEDVRDKFRAVYPEINWQYQLDYAEWIGLGTRNYELVRI
ncbi:MAG TPA: 4Fe-4S ferredoxin [Desulfotomaculum sp.]|nr:MAG: 4Fe-4S ferredoxin iron-sulfur binding domain-containing protein [Desulfotomaculum sp. 46_80]HBY03575.1 4Fe-4S ferredoxin [Desulfotomaculum sp.]